MLFQVYIDGPSIGQSYDSNYSLQKHFRYRRACTRGAKHAKKCYRLFLEAKFPVSSLTKLLCHFTLRGHRVIAFLPSLYDEKNSAVTGIYELADLISDLEEFRVLQSLGLIEFLDEKGNFGRALALKAEKEDAVIASSNIKVLLESRDNEFLTVNTFEESSISLDQAEMDNANGKPPTAQLSTGEPLCRAALNGNTAMGSGLSDLSFVVPVFYSFLERRGFVICPSLSKGVYPTTLEEILYKQSLKSNSGVAATTDQLTLLEQYRLTRAFSRILTGYFNGIPRFQRVLQILEEVLSFVDRQDNIVNEVREG